MNLSESFNMRGTEAVFEQMLEKDHSDSSVFRYLEIGIATGATLLAVADKMARKPSCYWRATGIDLVNSSFLNCDSIRRSGHPFSIISRIQAPVIFDHVDNDIAVLLLRDDERAIPARTSFLNFVLIDGCHGAPCVEKDFLSIEHAVAPGGIVAFHDAGEADQGIHFQAHCRQPISVLKALEKLGLAWLAYGGDKCTREGWKFIGSVDGDKSPGNLEQNGHGFAFFQKTI